MNFINSSYSQPPVVNFIIFIIFIAVILTVFVVSNIVNKKLKSEKKLIGVDGTLTLVVISGLLVLVGAWAFLTQYDDTKELRIKSIETTYGVNLTDDELKQLKYPESEPTQNIEFYGSLVNKDVRGLSESKATYTTLVWLNGEFRLLETDKESSMTSELPRV